MIPTEENINNAKLFLQGQYHTNQLGERRHCCSGVDFAVWFGGQKRGTAEG